MAISTGDFDGVIHLAAAAPVQPCSIVIFGASGDLAVRKLIPALYDLDACGMGMLAEETMILGCARSPMPVEQFREKCRDGVQRFSRVGLRPDCWSRFASRLDYLSGIDNSDGFGHLQQRLQQVEAAGALPPNRIFYLAIPPDAILRWVERLHESGLLGRPEGPGFSRVVVEKPIGTDLPSARAINQGLRHFLAESQIFRIDHYLGKESVRNFLVLRFGNSIFEQLWNSHHIDHIQITVSETEGVGTRAGYYDHAGALRDMVQNHLFQLVSLIAMEPPVSLEPEAIQDAKLDVLRAIRPLTPADVRERVVRAQYVAGEANGEPLKGYLEEPGVAPGSATETYVALELHINNWRWSGVPFYLRTGKRMPQRASSVAVHFKPLPRILFAENHELPADVLTLRIQPDEGFSLAVTTKQPGLDLAIRPVDMDLHYASAFGGSSPEAYEMLLYEVMVGDQTLFVPSDMVERSWQYIQSVLEAWGTGQGGELCHYAAGSWGPTQADALLKRSSRSWRKP